MSSRVASSWPDTQRHRTSQYPLTGCLRRLVQVAGQDLTDRRRMHLSQRRDLLRTIPSRPLRPTSHRHIRQPVRHVVHPQRGQLPRTGTAVQHHRQHRQQPRTVRVRQPRTVPVQRRRPGHVHQTLEQCCPRRGAHRRLQLRVVHHRQPYCLLRHHHPGQANMARTSLSTRRDANGSGLPTSLLEVRHLLTVHRPVQHPDHIHSWSARCRDT